MSRPTQNLDFIPTLRSVESDGLNGHSDGGFFPRGFLASQKDDFHRGRDDILNDSRGVQVTSSVQNDSVDLKQLVACLWRKRSDF